jgi:hypothetical protein
VWIYQRPEGPRFHLLQGADAGVSFNSLHGPAGEIEYTVACNAPPGASEIVELLDEAILGVDPG